MGRMKELFMEQQQNSEYRGAHDAMIHGLARTSVEEFIPDIEHVCPNCYGKSKLHSMIRNETEAECLDCGQEFIIIEKNTLRFK